MTDEQMKKGAKFSDYLSVIIKWKKFLIINLIIIIAISTTISFMIPQTYLASTTIMLPKNGDLFSSGQLGGLLSSVPFLSGKLGGSSGQSLDQIFGILNSRRVLVDVINKFNLMNYYEIKNNNYDIAIKAFRNDYSTDLDENSMINIKVINKSPDTSAIIANYLVNLLDSLNTQFNIQEAKNNRVFIQSRYERSVNDLNKAEDSLKKFQQKYGVYSVPQQIESALKIVGEMEGQLAQKEVEAQSIEQTVGKSSPVYQSYLSAIDMLKNRLSELKSANKLTFQSIVLIPFKNVPEMQEEYLNIYRDVKTQEKIIEFLLPLYEKAKIDEQKSIPTVIVLDKAYPPQLKYQPKKAFIILGITFPIFFIFLIMVFRGEKAYTRNSYSNIVEEKETNFYSKIVKIYKLKL